MTANKIENKFDDLTDVDTAVIECLNSAGLQKLGIAASYSWWDDPKRLVFSLSRYKFVSKMIEGYNNVLEVGCADGFASRIVAQSVNQLTAIDIIHSYIQSALHSNNSKKPINFIQHDILKAPVLGKFDAVYSLDVLEHIESKLEHVFISNLIQNLADFGICIIGMPSIESQKYASELSKKNHINCKNQNEFKTLMQKYFNVVLPFSSNDEMIHTGYHHMSHYNLMVCTGKKPIH